MFPPLQPHRILQFLLLCGVFLTGCPDDPTTFKNVCQSCEDRCLKLSETEYKCVACLTDQQCQTPSSPDKKCNEQFECVCGSDKDCSDGQKCDQTTGQCTGCTDDKDCTNASAPICSAGVCVACKASDKRDCVITDPTFCAKGAQACGADGQWKNCQIVSKKSCQASEFCREGECLCRTELTRCGQLCLNTRNDPNHCGKCDNKCPDKTFCAAGSCVSECPAETPTECGRSCANVSRDLFHCGSCGNTCKDGKECRGGTCVCPEGQIECNNQCIDPTYNTAHCGSCGNTCKSGQVCAAGACLSSCPKNTPKTCYGGCFDTQRSRQHCGQCGQACRVDQTCQAGQCKCPEGKQECNGACVDVTVHPGHCGKCANACKEGQQCTQGSCVGVCPSTTSTLCYGGCFSTKNSTQHCGKCGNTCQNQQVCTESKCACLQGESFCGNKCVNVLSNRLHCGQCDNRCPAGEVCAGGKCTRTCSSSTLLCDGGCVDVKKSFQHCGACGNRCQPGELCQQGVCSCNTGLQLCEGECVDLANSSKHCGRCGLTCAEVEACASGLCVYQGCADKTDCDKRCVDTKTDESNCGKCGTVCKSEELCLEGVCRIPCTNGDTRACYTGPAATQGVGTCQDGTQSCVNQIWNTCQGDTLPQTETCNNLDDDCNGQIDDNLARSCGIGECRGSEICNAGTWAACNGKKPANEVCDNKDNNCDGKVDEGLSCTLSWSVSTFAGTTDGYADGDKLQAQFSSPIRTLIDTQGNTFISDVGNHRIRMIDAKGVVTTFAGTGTKGTVNGGKATAQFSSPAGIAWGPQSQGIFMFVADFDGDKIRKIAYTNGAINVTTLAGSGAGGFKDGAAGVAEFNEPAGIAFDGMSNLYVADSKNHAIRKVDLQGNVTTVVGTGSAGFVNGNGTSAQLNTPSDVALDPNGNLLIVDALNHCIRILDVNTGNVSTFAGTGAQGSFDGPKAQAQFSGPFAIAFDGQGNLFVVEAVGHRVRMIDPKGNVTTIAGSTQGFSDGNNPLFAQFDTPSGIHVDSNGDLYIADQANHKIRLVKRTVAP
ncbi:MAG TPA: hypothetical protein DCE42_04625 [Myxococcales bacterium]|nr:hypothetical protein [Myxococcales bacterium]